MEDFQPEHKVEQSVSMSQPGSKPVNAPKKKKVKLDQWKLAVVVLAVLLALSVLSDGFTSGGDSLSSGNILSEQEAADKTLNYVNTQILQGQAVAELNYVEEEGDLYAVSLNVQGQEIKSYVTKDGSKFFPQGLDLDQDLGAEVQTAPSTPPPPSVDKSDKPEVELFVMSHCPYGTQMEKGILPVALLLEDKIDFDIKFVSYAMHGEVEVLEQLNQYCIETEQNDKYLVYLQCFLDAGDSEKCLTEVGIDMEMLEVCTEKADQEFSVKEKLADQASWLSGRFPQFNTHLEENQKYGVQGSPTLVINGNVVNAGRDSVSLLGAVCNSFNEKPEECNQQLEQGAPSPGFGWGTTGSNNLASCGGLA